MGKRLQFGTGSGDIYLLSSQPSHPSTGAAAADVASLLHCGPLSN